MQQLLQNVVNIAYAIILRRQNTWDNDIANTSFGDIGDLLKYCPTLVGYMNKYRQGWKIVVSYLFEHILTRLDYSRDFLSTFVLLKALNLSINKQHFFLTGSPLV